MSPKNHSTSYNVIATLLNTIYFLFSQNDQVFVLKRIFNSVFNINESRYQMVTKPPHIWRTEMYFVELFFCILNKEILISIDKTK